MSENIKSKFVNEKMANDIIKNLSMLPLNETGKRIRDKILTNLYLEDSYKELLSMFGDEKNELQVLEQLLNIKINEIKSELIKNKFYELLSNKSIGEKTILIIIEDFSKWLGSSEDKFLKNLRENYETIIALERSRVQLNGSTTLIKNDAKEVSKKLSYIITFFIILITIANILFYIKTYSTYTGKNNKIAQNNSKQNMASVDSIYIRDLNESLLDFEAPILQFHTLKNIIRIDKLSNGKYRYASFTYPKTTLDIPDTIIQTGYFDEKTSSFKFNVTFLGIVYAVVIDDGKPQNVNVYNNKQLLQKYEMKSIDYINNDR